MVAKIPIGLVLSTQGVQNLAKVAHWQNVKVAITKFPLELQVCKFPMTQIIKK